MSDYTLKVDKREGAFGDGFIYYLHLLNHRGHELITDVMELPFDKIHLERAWLLEKKDKMIEKYEYKKNVLKCGLPVGVSRL